METIDPSSRTSSLRGSATKECEFNISNMAYILQGLLCPLY